MEDIILIPGEGWQYCLGDGLCCNECEYFICCNDNGLCDQCFEENGGCKVGARHRMVTG